MDRYLLPHEKRKELMENALESASPKIPLIQAFRKCTGASLKEAKEAIDGAETPLGMTPFNIPLLSKIFLYSGTEPDDGLVPLPEAFDKAQFVENKDSSFIDAMRNIESNWQVLGFSSLQNGVEAVMRNF